MNSGTELWEEKAKALIPGGTQLLSKRSEMFLPEQWPAYYESADGIEITDLDGNQYLDMSIMGVGACILGYGHRQVDEQVKNAVEKSSMSTLNNPEEVELSERFVDLHPWADMVRLARTGGEAMAIAIRLARASTNQDTIAFCGYHGWHDWYLAANLSEDDNLEEHLLPGLDPKGVPSALAGTAKPFRYGETEALERLVSKYDIGAIVMEPVRNIEADAEFLHEVRDISTELGIPLIFDEITSGFRVRLGGAHVKWGVSPDVAVYGKALGNGYPIAAIVGRESVMNMAQESFISSTFWTERIGPTAGLATLDVLEKHSVPEHIVALGEQLQSGLRDHAKATGIPIDVEGLPPLTHFGIDVNHEQAAKTLFTQDMLAKGYLAGDTVYLSYAHTEEIIQEYLDDVLDVFDTIASSLENNTVHEKLDGPIAHSKFERLN